MKLCSLSIMLFCASSRQFFMPLLNRTSQNIRQECLNLLTAHFKQKKREIFSEALGLKVAQALAQRFVEFLQSCCFKTFQTRLHCQTFLRLYSALIHQINHRSPVNRRTGSFRSIRNCALLSWLKHPPSGYYVDLYVCIFARTESCTCLICIFIPVSTSENNIMVRRHEQDGLSDPFLEAIQLEHNISIRSQQIAIPLRLNMGELLRRRNPQLSSGNAAGEKVLKPNEV